MSNENPTINDLDNFECLLIYHIQLLISSWANFKNERYKDGYIDFLVTIASNTESYLKICRGYFLFFQKEICRGIYK